MKKAALIIPVIIAVVLTGCSIRNRTSEEEDLTTRNKRTTIAQEERFGETLTAATSIMTATSADNVVTITVLPSDPFSTVYTQPTTVFTTQATTRPTTRATTTTRPTTRATTTTTRPTTRTPSTTARPTTRTTARPTTTTARPTTTNARPTTTTARPTTTTTTRQPSTRISYGNVSFYANDIYGNPASLSDLRNSGAKIIVINMWEPWCPPCKSELPDLQRLYANYKDDGLVIVGAFDDNYSDAVSLVAGNGITYPVIQGTQSFSDYYTGYVPTTIIIDSYGNVLTSEPIVGAMSYSQWEATVRPYLY